MGTQLVMSVVQNSFGARLHVNVAQLHHANAIWQWSHLDSCSYFTSLLDLHGALSLFYFPAP